MLCVAKHHKIVSARFVRRFLRKPTLLSALGRSCESQSRFGSLRSPFSFGEPAPLSGLGKLCDFLLSQGLVGLSGLEPPTSRLSGARSNRLSYKPISLGQRALRVSASLPYSPPPSAFSDLGGDEENRTPDPLLARQVLSQLSYTPGFHR